MENGHLTAEEIEQLSSEAGAGPGEGWSHAENCPQCGTLLAKYQAVGAKLSKLTTMRTGSNPGTNCPDERVWFEVAAGTLSPAESLAYVEHAAECDACGKKLRAAARILEEELTEEEERAINALPSAGISGQREMAEKLSTLRPAERQKVKVPKPRRPVWRKWTYAFGAVAALILVLFVSLGTITDSLLARGYSERGTLEFRIAKADPPKEGTRGATPEERERPLSLVVSDLLIRTRLGLNSKNPYWLAEKGRLELLEGKPAAALTDLQEAHQLDPGSKTTTVDLASAYAQTGSAENLFQAENLLLSILPAEKENPDLLRTDPLNILAVYNLAIIYEKTGSFDQAIRELELYLTLDPDSSWSDAAKSRLENIRNQKHGKAPPAPTASASEWLAYLNSGEPNASEAALDVAMAEWLPRRSAKSGDVEPLLLFLSKKLQTQHRDFWLADVLSVSPSSELDSGFEHLKQAIKQNAIGDFEGAVVSTKRAEAIFRRTAELAGLVRAELEETYSYQRSARGELCLQSAHEVEASQFSHEFPWITIQLHLDRSSCLNLLGRLEEAKMEADDAERIVGQFGYRILQLRASGIRAGVATSRGDHAAALNIDVVGLQQCWLDWYPSERPYQFLSDITFNAEAKQLWHVAFDSGVQAAFVISQTSHLELEALTRYRIAKALIMIDLPNAAGGQLERADKLFSSLPQTSSIVRYRTDGLLAVAKANSDKGKENDALSMLEQSASASSLETQLVLRRLHQLRGDIALRQGHLEEATGEYSIVIQFAESALASLTTMRDRFIWSRTNVWSYKSLIELLIQQNKTADAFALWESYKGASLPRRQSGSDERDMLSRGPFASAHFHRLSDTKLPIQELKQGEGLISYVFLNNSLTAWYLDHDGLKIAQLNEPVNWIRNKLRDFNLECSRPDSDLQKLHVDGKRLYTLLLSSFSTELSHIDTLIIEGDEETEALPFEALTTESGEYLADHITVVYSPGLVVQAHLRPSRRLTTSARALVVGAPTLSARWTSVLPPLPSALSEANEIHRLLPHSTLLTEGHATRSALLAQLPFIEVFHFAGHSIQTSSGAGLILAANNESPNEEDILTPEQLFPEHSQTLQLVTLSACTTGVLRTGGVINFIQPLWIAGVPQVIVSKWQVDSPNTTVLMTHFYRLLVNDNKLSAVALSGAQSIVRRARPHPYYWASFALIGHT